MSSEPRHRSRRPTRQPSNDSASRSNSNAPRQGQFNRNANRRRLRSSSWTSCIDTLGLFIAAGVLALVAMLVMEIYLPDPQQRVWFFGLAISYIPVVMTAYAALGRGQKPLHERITPSVFFVTIISAMLPTFLKAFIAASALFFLSWATRPHDDEVNNNPANKGESKSKSSDNEDEIEIGTNKTKPLGSPTTTAQVNLTKAIRCGVLLTMVMLTENMFVWVVSATFEPGQKPGSAPEALQDNGQILLRYIFHDVMGLTGRDVVHCRRLWNVQYALVTAMGAGLFVADFHPVRQLWGASSRVLLTLASARAIRTVSFLMTVLPNQHQNCYILKYPYPPPDKWWDWIKVGFQPAANGGCNDLIISGHATVTSTAACLVVSLADDTLFSCAVWWLVALDYSIEVYQGFHYAVDMWLGAVLVGLLWRVLKPIEDNNTERNAKTIEGIYRRWPQESFELKDVLKYGLPAYGVFVQLTFFPGIMGNVGIVFFTVWGVTHIALYGLQHFSIHLFYCSVMTGIGTYL